MDFKNFYHFFITGNFSDFSSATLDMDIIKLLGNPDEIEDYGESGKFFHYGDIRFALSKKGILGYIDFFFLNTLASFEVQVEDKWFAINKETNVLNILQLLNLAGLQWEILIEDSKFDYMIIAVSNGIRIYYYYESAQLERIRKEYSN